MTCCCVLGWMQVLFCQMCPGMRQSLRRQYICLKLYLKSLCGCWINRFYLMGRISIRWDKCMRTQPNSLEGYLNIMSASDYPTICIHFETSNRCLKDIMFWWFQFFTAKHLITNNCFQPWDSKAFHVFSTYCVLNKHFVLDLRSLYCWTCS